MAAGVLHRITPAQAVEIGFSLPEYDSAWEPENESNISFESVISQLCTHEQIRSDRFQYWCDELDQRRLCHRKQWEWCYILQALDQSKVLVEGARGLGFGVGTEPIASYIASRGCLIVATDLPVEDGGHEAWADTEQHADNLDLVNSHGLCSSDEFQRLVSFRPVNMNAVPEDLTGFDFTWSSCAFEHVGSLELGAEFVLRSMDCLKPGGVAVHTTEFNVSSNGATVESGPTVAYRRKDIEGIVANLRSLGHHVEVSFALGESSEDRHIDVVPYTNTHLKVRLEDQVITSIGLVVVKAA